MAASSSHPEIPRKILVIGGTGAQGQEVVKALVRDKKYIAKVLTRDTVNPVAQQLAALGNVELVQGSYEKDADLRKALSGAWGVYVNFDSSSMTAAAEYFWSFRVYDLAVQAGIKHFVYSSLPGHPRRFRYADEYHASHIVTKSRIGQWLAAQPVTILPWTVLIGTLYTEMLSHVVRPQADENGIYIFPLATGDGHIHFTEIEQYGTFARWIFDHPDRSIGKEISLGIFSATSQEVVDSFTEVTGLPAAVAGSSDQFFINVSAVSDPDAKMPVELPGGQDDDSRITFRQSFTAFWNIWRSTRAEDIQLLPGRELADEIHPNRMRSVKEWMRASNYTGEFQLTLKKTIDAKVTRSR